jgi:hypothetical protein
MVVAFSLYACGGGHGGSSPTAPTQPANVAGTWLGTWTITSIPTSVPLNPVMAITQIDGSNTTGSISLLGVTLNTTGSVNTAASSYQWQAINPGCGTFTGSASFGGLTPTVMNGTADLNTVGCAGEGGGEILSGPVTWSLEGSPAAAHQSAARHGALNDIVKAIRGIARR